MQNMRYMTILITFLLLCYFLVDKASRKDDYSSSDSSMI